MRFSVVFAALASVVCSTAIPHNPTQNQLPLSIYEKTNDADISLQSKEDSVPGGSGFRYCESQKDNVFQITKLNIDPESPKTGDILTLKLTGTFTESLTPSSLIIATHTINGHQGRGALYFCDMIHHIEQDDNATCPPKEGTATMELADMLPRGAPGGKYEFRYEAVTEAWEDVFCVEGMVMVED